MGAAAAGASSRQLGRAAGRERGAAAGNAGPLYGAAGSGKCGLQEPLQHLVY